MLKLLAIGLGGFVGAILRYGVAGFIQRAAGIAFPWGTFAVNAAGCFALGAVLYLSEERAVISPAMRTFLAIGVLGAFTTFSTFGYETFELLRNNSPRLAFLNIGGSVLVGLAAVWAGRTLPRLIGL